MKNNGRTKKKIMMMIIVICKGNGSDNMVEVAAIPKQKQKQQQNPSSLRSATVPVRHIIKGEKKMVIWTMIMMDIGYWYSDRRRTK